MELETKRLILREFNDNDVQRLFLLDSHPEVMKYLGVKAIDDISATKSIIENVKTQYKNNGIGRWAVIEKESNLLIGWSGLKLLTEPINHYQNIYDLGYRFLPEYWGKGYATESSQTSLVYGFNELNINIIYAHAHIENLASNHVLKKLGFIEKQVFEDKGDLCNWYELEKQNFNIK